MEKFSSDAELGMGHSKCPVCCSRLDFVARFMESFDPETEETYHSFVIGLRCLKCDLVDSLSTSPDILIPPKRAETYLTTLFDSTARQFTAEMVTNGAGDG